MSNSEFYQITPRDLTPIELWMSWPILRRHISDWSKLGKYYYSTGLGLVPAARASSESSYPARRTDYQLTNPIVLEWQNLRRYRKLKLVTSALTSYIPSDLEEDGTRGVDDCIFLAFCGKEEADRTFRSGDWEKAWFQYALAWTTLLPYHIDAFPIGGAKRNNLAEIENLVFGKIMACVIVCVRDVKQDEMVKDIACHAGIVAGQLLVEQRFGCTAGRLRKALERLEELRTIKAGIIGFRNDLVHILQQLFFQRLKRELEFKTDPREYLYIWDYRLTGLTEVMMVPKWLWDMCPDDRIESIWIDQPLI